MSERLSPLHQMTAATRTDYWNDSCPVQELSYAIANDAVGATSNPTIVLAVLKKELGAWRERIARMITENRECGDVEITWKLIEEMSVKAAGLLAPVFEWEQGRKSWLSVQTNPSFYRNADAIVTQALHFRELAANIQVKIPVTQAGINSIGGMFPVCTIMIGRRDDWLKGVVTLDDVLITPGYLDWAGIAAIRKAYAIFQQRGYRSRLLVAAYRHHLHWSELIGGDLILTIPNEWQLLFNQSDIEVKERMQNLVDPRIISELCSKPPDFRGAYDENGLAVEECDQYGATVRTLRTFIGSYAELLAFVGDFMLPDPDKKPVPS